VFSSQEIVNLKNSKGADTDAFITIHDVHDVFDLGFGEISIVEERQKGCLKKGNRFKHPFL
jgi:hypothetical protein